MHPNNKYDCTTPEERPDHKLTPKRKREEVADGSSKRANTASDPQPVPRITPINPSLSRPKVHIDPPLTPQQIQAQQIRERLAQHHQLKQENIGTNLPRANAATTPAPTPRPPPSGVDFNRVYATSGDFRANATPGMTGVKHEPVHSSQVSSRASTAVSSHKPPVVNLDTHECNGCEDMCQKMTSLCNALGANILFS